MGNRIVVMLNTDAADQWTKDPELGKKFLYASTSANRRPASDESRLGNYGQVVQCVDSHSETLVLLSGYTGCEHIAGKFWTREETSEQVLEKLLRDAAEKMGFQLVKKAKKT